MPTESNVLCGCGRFMRCKKNGVTVEELTDAGEPYKLWDADLYECADCGVEVVTGFGRVPMAEHWQPTYDAQRARLAPIRPGRCRETNTPTQNSAGAWICEHGTSMDVHCCGCHSGFLFDVMACTCLNLKGR